MVKDSSSLLHVLLPAHVSISEGMQTGLSVHMHGTQFPMQYTYLTPGGVGQDHVNPDFADSALLLPLNLYGEKRRPFCWANKTCRALL